MLDLWLSIALAAHILFGIVFVNDRFLVSKVAPNPLVYTFLVGILQGLVILLIPAALVAPLFPKTPLSIFFPKGFFIPEINELILITLAGASFVLALFIFYNALKIGEASRVVPISGSANPVAVFLLGIPLLAEKFSSPELAAFILLVIGGILISFKRLSFRAFLPQEFALGVLAGATFGLFAVFSKMVFLTMPFLNGFIWIRLMGLLFVLFLLILPSLRQGIARTPKVVTSKQKILFFANQGLAGLAATLQHFAVFLGKPALVNALQGVQYLVLLVILIVLARYFPKFLKEELKGAVLVQKIIAILLIGLGLVLLTQLKFSEVEPPD